MEIEIRSNKTKYVLLELLAVSLLATGGIFVKFSSLGPINTGFYRVLFSLPILFLLAYKNLNQLKKKDVLILLLSGVFLAGDVSLWNLSFSYTSVANANLFANLTPFTVVPVSYFLFKEKIPKFYLVGALIAIAGVVILVLGKANPTNSNYIGDLLSFGASFFYAGFLLITYSLSTRISSSVMMFVSGFGSLAALFASSSAIEGFQIPHGWHEVWPLLGLTICLQVVGHNLLAHCQGNVNVNLSSVICLMQPVIATVYAFVCFGETISVVEMAGIAVVIAGVFMVKMQYSGRNGRGKV